MVSLYFSIKSCFKFLLIKAWLMTWTRGALLLPEKPSKNLSFQKQRNLEQKKFSDKLKEIWSWTHNQQFLHWQGAVQKRYVQSVGGGVCPEWTCGRPPFLVQKFFDLWYVCTDKGKGEGWSSAEIFRRRGEGGRGKFSRFCADVFYGRPPTVNVQWLSYWRKKTSEH